MKKTLSALAIVVVMVACRKESTQRGGDTPSYIGVYNSISGDTAYVTTSNNDGVVKIRWASLGTAAKIMFDTVRVANDLSFTVNQRVEYFGTIPVIGTGSFGTNLLSFHFVIGGSGHIIFSGVKSN